MELKDLLLCQSSNELDEQWRILYEEAFPAGEREPADKLSRLIEEGKLLYHRTVNEQGDLLCFTMVTLAPSFSFLAYMASNPRMRSGGVGTKHLKRLLELLRARYPHHLGVFLEIEATAPTLETLTDEERVSRLRRRKFYEDRIGARVLCQDVPYLTPRYGNEKTKEWEGELLCIEFGDPICQSELTRVICEIYERFYLLPPDHALVKRVVTAFANCKHTCDVAKPKAPTRVEPPTTDVRERGETPSPNPKAGTNDPVPPAPVSPPPTCFLCRLFNAFVAFFWSLLRGFHPGS